MYLSHKPQPQYLKYAPVLPKVDPQGLILVADLPSLVNHGAYYDEGEGIIWFDSKTTPPGGLPAEMQIEDLLIPGGHLTELAIRLTGSAACLDLIPPDLIELAKRRTEPDLDALAC